LYDLMYCRGIFWDDEREKYTNGICPGGIRCDHAEKLRKMSAEMNDFTCEIYIIIDLLSKYDLFQ